MNVHPFSLLYRVFYDKTLAEKYIKNGKGSGLKALLVLSLFVAFLTALDLFFIARSLSMVSVSLLEDPLPDIQIKQGQIVAPADYERVYISPNHKVFVALDTTSRPFSMEGLPREGYFFSKNTFTLVNKGRSVSVPLEKMTGKADFILDQANMEKVFSRFLKYFINFMPGLIFIILIPNLFFTYVLTACFFALVSYGATPFFKLEMAFEARMRLAALCVMPMYILNAVAQFLGRNISIQVELGILITGIYMFCFLKELTVHLKQLINKQV